MTRQTLQNSITNSLVIGIGNTVSSQIAVSCNIKFSSLNTKYSANCSCLVLKELTGLIPKYPVNIYILNLPKGIVLADPTFNQPAPVDVLLGANLFWDILDIEQRSFGTHNTNLRNTHLGWIISGPIYSTVADEVTLCNQATVDAVSNQSDIESSIAKFWELEEVPTKRVLSESEMACESHFVTHTRGEVTGSFCIKLPLPLTLAWVTLIKLLKNDYDNYKNGLGKIHY